MSTSNVPYAEPYDPPATPPIRTKSTPAIASASRIGIGSNVSGSGGTLQLVHAARPGRLIRDAALGRLTQRTLVERAVVSVVDLLGLEHEPLAHQVEEVGEGRDRRRDEAALDAGDRRLARARPRCELALRQAVPPPGGNQEFCGRLHPDI